MQFEGFSINAFFPFCLPSPSPKKRVTGRKLSNFEWTLEKFVAPATTQQTLLVSSRMEQFKFPLKCLNQQHQPQWLECGVPVTNTNTPFAPRRDILYNDFGGRCFLILYILFYVLGKIRISRKNIPPWLDQRVNLQASIVLVSGDGRCI